MENDLINISIEKLISVIFHTIKLSTKIFQDLKSEKYEMIVFPKGPKDHFTNIDWSIQKIMENYLNFYFPNIKIVGEEDTSNNLVQSDIFQVDESLKLNWDIVPLPEKINYLPMKDIKIYIDPVDATSLLIKKIFDPVMILIGIAYKEKPLIGFSTYPLYENTNKSIIYFNIPEKGIYEYDIYDEKFIKIKITENLNKDLIVRYNMNKEKDLVCQKLNDWNLIRGSGYANKAILAIKKNAPYYSSMTGLGPWDTCAVNALALENGGSINKLDGSEIIYTNELDKNGLDFPVVYFPNEKRKKDFFDDYQSNTSKF